MPPRSVPLLRTAALAPGPPLARNSQLQRSPLFLVTGGGAPVTPIGRTRNSGPYCVPDYLTAYARARIQIQPNGCWHWTGSIDSRGYGVANLPGGKRDAAHRYVYKQVHGEIPGSKHLDHQCHNRDTTCAGGSTCLHRRCVNPSHVEPATPRENVLRGKTQPALNLAKEKCPEGHDYDRTDSRGWRKCSICDLAKQEAKRRAAGIPERKLWQPTCANGHEFTPETTRWSKGNRYCKTCDHERIVAAAESRRKPCKGCGGPKEPGAAYKYCEKCRQVRGGSSKGPTKEVRRLVLERDGFCCVCCGRSIIGQRYSLGHRLRASQGGKATPENLLTFLGWGGEQCHGRIDLYRDEADELKGYRIHSGIGPEHDPLYVPVTLFNERKVWLTPDGDYAYEPPEDGAA